MQETWTTRHSDIELDGYSHPIHSFRRFQNKRAKRASGGLIIYIKDNIRKGVKLIKNEVDCLIWLKFDKCFFQISEDIYLCVAYIPPENSVFHNMFDGDILRLLEDDISLYQNRGKIFLTGDLNGRTSIKPDFIENDRSIIIQNEVNQLDTPIPRFCIGESPSICPFLKNNGPEALKGPRVHYFSGMDRYEDFLRLKIHHIFYV